MPPRVEDRLIVVTVEETREGPPVYRLFPSGDGRHGFLVLRPERGEPRSRTIARALGWEEEQVRTLAPLGTTTAMHSNSRTGAKRYVNTHAHAVLLPDPPPPIPREMLPYRRLPFEAARWRTERASVDLERMPAWHTEVARALLRWRREVRAMPPRPVNG